MRRFRFDITILAAVMYPLLYYLDDSGFFTAALPAIFFHELGHCAAVWLCGGRVLSLRLDAAGLCLSTTPLSPAASVLCSLSGPLLGFLWASAARLLPSIFWQNSARVAFLLNTLNLLPALPLDGGHILLELSGSITLLRICTLVISALFAAVAVYLGNLFLFLPVLLMLRAVVSSAK